MVSSLSADEISHFKQASIQYLDAIATGKFEPHLSVAPLKKIVVEAKRQSVQVPDGVDEFIAVAELKKKSTPPLRPNKRKLQVSHRHH